MIVQLTHDIIVNDGKRGVMRKKGERVDVEKHVAAMLTFNNQAEYPKAGEQKKAA